jgi:hypothetical protein
MAGSHKLALGFFAAVVIAWAGLFALTLKQAALPPEASGRVVAVYPLGWSAAASMAAALRTEGRLVRETWLPNILEVASNDPGFAGRLQQAGAVGVYRAQPFDLFMLAGCTGMPPGPLTRSLRRFG